MATLIFYDDSHRYTVDGEEVPSVSELTRFIARELYSETPQFAMDSAASRGTAIHKATEALDKFGTVEIPDDIAEYLKAYVAFVKENKPEWEKIEWSVCKDTLYAGTLDRFGTLDGKRVIVDVKSTATITPLHRTLYTAQLNLYRMAVESVTPVDALYVLQLKKDGKYKLIELPVEDDLANACITLHQATKKRKRRKAND